jgi:hypothetical protein
MDKLYLNGFRYFLHRDRDDAGDSGSWLEAFDWDNQSAEHEQNVIEVGKGVRCGSLYARSFCAQDWWLTTPVKEILEVERNDDDEIVKVRFLTESKNGSTYTLTVD